MLLIVVGWVGGEHVWSHVRFSASFAELRRRIGISLIMQGWLTCVECGGVSWCSNVGVVGEPRGWLDGAEGNVAGHLGFPVRAL